MPRALAPARQPPPPPVAAREQARSRAQVSPRSVNSCYKQCNEQTGHINDKAKLAPGINRSAANNYGKWQRSVQNFGKRSRNAFEQLFHSIPISFLELLCPRSSWMQHVPLRTKLISSSRSRIMVTKTVHIDVPQGRELRDKQRFTQRDPDIVKTKITHPYFPN